VSVLFADMTRVSAFVLPRTLSYLIMSFIYVGFWGNVMLH
jgi:hypothetical protein